MQSRSSRRTLPTKRSAIALARGARTGVLMIRTSTAVNTASNAAVNLALRSRIRNRSWRSASARSMSGLRACWVSQAPVGWGGDPEDVYTPGGVLDDEEGIQPVQGDGVEMEQVAGQDHLCLGVQNLPPGRACTTKRGVDPALAKDVPDGGGADPVAEAGQLAVDPAVAPGGILDGQAHGQGPQTGGDG